jgi:hypothetical protein
VINLIDFLGDIPEWKRYHTVDEIHEKIDNIAKEYPGKIKYIDLGKSTKGESIECLKVGDGKYNALIHGFPNSEEPIGGNLLLYLARRLAEENDIREELDYNWYLIGCSDPDGARLNEGFQLGPHTPLNFSRNYYRTPTRLTPEWYFPFNFPPLHLNNPVPETRALMKLMDQIEFHFISSLHMMKWGGITYQVPHSCPELYAPLWNSARKFNIFLRKRPAPTVAPGVSKAYYLTVARGYLRQWASGNENIEPINGCYIYEYGQMLNPHLFMMIPECCLWYDPRMWDDTPTNKPLGDSLQYAYNVTTKTESFMLGIWERALPNLKSNNPFKVMIAEMMKPLQIRYTNVSNPPLSFNENVHTRNATVAEKIAVEGRELSFRMTHLGGLKRVFDKELKHNSNSKIEKLRDEVQDKLIEYDRRLHADYDVTINPIRNNVGACISAILNSAIYAKNRQP